VDATRRELHRPDGALVPTTDAEFDLLWAFLERPQRVLSREQLLDLARGRAAQLFDRSIDVAVMRLRRKIEPDPTKPEIIRTVRNGGYMFARVLGVSPSEAVVIGKCVSGFYVREGRGPSPEEVVGFGRRWIAGSLDPWE
jgi:hypothetical protein